MSDVPRRTPANDPSNPGHQAERLRNVVEHMNPRSDRGGTRWAQPVANREVALAGSRGIGSRRGGRIGSIKHYNEILKTVGGVPAFVVDEPWFHSDCASGTGWTSASYAAVEAGRNGDGFRFTTGNAYKDLGVAQSAEVLVGFAFKPPDPMSGLTPGALLRFYGDAGSTLHLSVNLATDGTLSVVSGATTLGSTAAGAVSAGWQYVEVQVVLGDLVGGLVRIHVDGASVLELDACDTRNGGTVLAIDRVWFGSFTASSWLDDVYIDVGQPWAADDPGATPAEKPYDLFAGAAVLIAATDGAFEAPDVHNVGYGTETGEPG